MRTSFIEQLIQEAKENKKIFLLVGDLGFSVVEPFAELFPKRFINVGVAEQNMAGIASGLATEGYCVFIYSIGNFPTLRCMEQIRYDICYHDLNVKIVAVGGGFAYGPLGSSHHTTEELGMLRTLPNLTVCSPADPFETRAIVTFAATHPHPCYIRLGKSGELTIHKRKVTVDLGNMIRIKDKGSVAVFACGSIVKYVLDFIEQNKINAQLFSFPFVKPINSERILEILKTIDKIITIEEHQIMAGFGSAIIETISDLYSERRINKMPIIRRIAIKDKFLSVSGSQDYLRKLAGLELNKEDFII
jgi:transketolase